MRSLISFLLIILTSITYSQSSDDKMMELKSNEELYKVFNKFYTTVQAFPNFIDDYDVEGCCVFIFSIPTDFTIDYNLMIQGKYSEISANAKKLILGNHYFPGKAYTLPLILNKAIVLKDSWEDRLSNVGSPAYLYDQEVWPIIDSAKEILTQKVVDNYSENKKLTPSGDFF